MKAIAGIDASRFPPLSTVIPAQAGTHRMVVLH
jgi:hypothetical protein